MKKEFSFYEFTGTVIPGATLILGLAFAHHPLRDFLVGDKFGAGHLGLFLVASYIAGQLVQGIGNLLEKVLWAFRGMPSTWIRRAKPPYLSDTQTKRLREVLTTLLGHEVGPLQNLDARACHGITGQLYAKLEKEGRAQRIDIFNGNYGLRAAPEQSWNDLRSRMQGGLFSDPIHGKEHDSSLHQVQRRISCTDDLLPSSP